MKFIFLTSGKEDKGDKLPAELKPMAKPATRENCPFLTSQLH